MTQGKSNVLAEFVERHSRVWRALAEAGFGTLRSGPCLETGHHVAVAFDDEEGQWFARLTSPSPSLLGPDPWTGGEYLLLLGPDDAAVPERLRQELGKPEVMEYLRASMR